VTQERIGAVGLDLAEAREYARANFLHHLATFCKGWQPERPALTSGMLEGIEETRHLHELDRSIEVPGQPQFFEMRDVPEIPDDRAHERVMLQPQLRVSKWLNQQECPGPSFPKLRGYGLAIYSPRHGNRRHDISAELEQ
jgi:hypothetical protein